MPRRLSSLAHNQTCCPVSLAVFVAVTCDHWVSPTPTPQSLKPSSLTRLALALVSSRYTEDTAPPCTWLKSHCVQVTAPVPPNPLPSQVSQHWPLTCLCISSICLCGMFCRMLYMSDIFSSGTTTDALETTAPFTCAQTFPESSTIPCPVPFSGAETNPLKLLQLYVLPHLFCPPRHNCHQPQQVLSHHRAFAGEMSSLSTLPYPALQSQN